MRALVWAEHDNAELKVQTLHALAAAAKFGDVDVLIAGANCTAVVDAAQSIAGVTRVLVCDDPRYAHQLAEDVAPLLVSLAGEYEALLAAATTSGKNVMPRVAALLDVQQISDIIDIIDAHTFKRPIYAGNAIATVKSTDAKTVITVRPTAFDAVPTTGGSAQRINVSPKDVSGLATFVSADIHTSERPDLSTARVVVSGGRAVGSAENFKLIETLADTLGGAVGASRAAVDAGFVPNDQQVGQTGKVVAPELYIAVGISGAIQHLAGMKESRVIVAINTDPDAPIFQVADYGLVADLFDAVPALSQALSQAFSQTLAQTLAQTCEQ